MIVAVFGRVVDQRRRQSNRPEIQNHTISLDRLGLHLKFGRKSPTLRMAALPRRQEARQAITMRIRTHSRCRLWKRAAFNGTSMDPASLLFSWRAEILVVHSVPNDAQSHPLPPRYTYGMKHVVQLVSCAPGPPLPLSACVCACASVAHCTGNGAT